LSLFLIRRKKMRKRIIPSSFIIALLFFLVSSGAAFAGSNYRAGIAVDFNSTGSGDDGENTITGVGPEQNLRIDVYAHDVTALKCYEFDMVIDTSNVSFLSVTPTATNFDPNILEGAVTWVGQKSGNTISIAYANDTTPDGANGDGLLAEINIRTKSSFTTSTQALFTIISIVFVDTGGVNDPILNLNTYHIDGAINPTDAIPPDPVTDLVATPSGTDSTITLTWTNPPPGDAVTCIFKYAVNPILTEADWEDATLLANADFQAGTTPAPSAETATVIGLPEGDYYFAMKTMDSTPNVSELFGYTVFGKVGLADNPSDSSGSVVCLDSRCDTTDIHGDYSIFNISGGTYDIIATHSGYYPDTLTVTVSSDTTVNFSLIPISFKVSGTVGLADNPSDSSGSVVCIGSRCDTTDIHGDYSISDVSGGTYDIIATHEGYYPDTVSIILSSDTTVNFSLIRIIYDVGASITSCPDTLYPNEPDSVYITISNYGNVTAEDIEVNGWLDPDSAQNCTTFVISLTAGQSLDFTSELLFDDPDSCTYVAHICAKLSEDSNPSNDCDQDTFYYTEVESRRISPKLPTAYSLSQNYPNPFNPLTQIEYSIPHRGWVRLEVYNILGEKVATLVDRLQEPGFYKIGWDAGYLKSGVYFCHMEAGSFTFTRRMVLLK
jgi:hypothetical protein